MLSGIYFSGLTAFGMSPTKDLSSEDYKLQRTYNGGKVTYKLIFGGKNIEPYTYTVTKNIAASPKSASVTVAGRGKMYVNYSGKCRTDTIRARIYLGKTLVKTVSGGRGRTSGKYKITGLKKGKRYTIKLYTSEYHENSFKLKKDGSYVTDIYYSDRWNKTFRKKAK